MSFDSLLRHRVAIIRQVPVLDAGEPTYDDRGQPITEPVTIQAEWRCRIEPKTAREVAQLSQAGPVVADHTIFGRPTDLATGDALLATDGRAFEVMPINDAGGAGHHLEVDVRRIAASEVETS